MSIGNKEKFLQQKNEIRSIRYFYSGTDIYDTYKDIETLAEKQHISADFLYDLLVKEPVSINKGLETYITKYRTNNREDYVFIQILRYKKFWKPDVTDDEVDRRYYEATGEELLHTDLSEEELDARMQAHFLQQEEKYYNKFIKSSVCNNYYKLNTEPTEENVWRHYHYMEQIRDDLRGISNYLNNGFKTDFDIVDKAKYEDAVQALQTLSDYLSHLEL